MSFRQAATGVARATGRHRPWLVVTLRRVFRVVFRGLFDLRVVGQPHVPAGGGVILAGNHTGLLDGPLVFVFAPRCARFLTKAEVFRYRLLARGLGWLGQIAVHRGTADRTALRTALDELAGGGVVGVFPEGRRGAGELTSVEHGVAYLAVKSGCPVVPVACIGTAAALPKGGRTVRLRSPITVAFGQPFVPDQRAATSTRQAVTAAAEDIRRHLVEHLAATAVVTRGRPTARDDEPARLAPAGHAFADGSADVATTPQPDGTTEETMP